MTSTRALAGLALALLCAPAGAQEWTEEALLHDGRIVEVRRQVHYRFGSGELSDALRKSPTQFSLRARNPDTGEAVRWDGEDGWTPLLLGFHERRAHLVILVGRFGPHMKAFGCPDIPYVFLRTDERGRWQQVSPKEWPRQLLTTNLSPSYEKYAMDKGRLRHDEVAVLIDAAGRRNDVERTLPLDFASWRARNKNIWRNNPAPGCEHTLPSDKDPGHPMEAGQPAITVALEVLESVIYDPPWTMTGKEWRLLSWDAEHDKRCSGLVRLVNEATDRPELRGWLVFTKDETRTRKAKYPVGKIWCDDKAIWMVQYHLPPDTAYAFISKFSHAGELLYRVKFEKPVPSRYGFDGGLLQSRFRAAEGILYLEWWNTNQSGSDRQVSRAMKVRLKEPG